MSDVQSDAIKTPKEEMEVPVSAPEQDTNTATTPKESEKMAADDEPGQSNTSDSVTEKEAETDPYAYAKDGETFTSESFKIEIMNLPKYCGFKVIIQWQDSPVVMIFLYLCFFDCLYSI